MELRRMIKNAGKGLAGLGLAWLLFSGDANAQAPPQYEPNWNAKRLIEVMQLHMGQGKRMYEKSWYMGNDKWEVLYIDNGDRKIGQGDKLELTIRRNGKKEYHFMDYNLDGLYFYNVARGIDDFKAPNEEYNLHRSILVDDSEDNVNGFMNDIYMRKVSEAIEHLEEQW
jgi:hypothetical protein